MSSFQSAAYALKVGFLLLLLVQTPALAQENPYLSSLNVTSEDPLYATYAAPLHRSQFVVDQGYQFVFYRPEAGIDFRTDHAGVLSLAFRQDGVVRYALRDMYEAPVVTTSYSDLVKYRYRPFENVRVEVFFQVYSSRLAIQDVTVTNVADHPVTVDVYPFLQHEAGVREVQVNEAQGYFSFVHEEPVDGWTKSHDVPYEPRLRNVYLVDAPIDAYGGYTSIGTPAASTSAASAHEAGRNENYFVEWGRVYHADGSLCLHTPPRAHQVIYHNGTRSEILTADAPKFDPAEGPNIPGNGYQGAELGNFQDPPLAVGDSFTVVFTCQATGQQGAAQGEVTSLPGDARVDVQLAQASFPSKPRELAVEFSQDGMQASLTWSGDAAQYDVYRRTAATPGRFGRVAEGVADEVFVDEGLTAETQYNYLVVARNTDGRLSPPSLEAGELSTRTLFSDLQSDSLHNQLPADGAGAVAFQTTLQLAPGESSSVRITRGVAPLDMSLSDLLEENRSLLTYDMSEAVLADERLYSQIPDYDFTSSAREATYWNSYNLMRQVMLPPEGQLTHNYYVFSREPTWGWGHGGQVFHESLTMLAYVFMDPESAQGSQRVYMEEQADSGYINYRTGAYLSEQIPHDGSRTSSAPWFNWINWELYKQTQDRQFLQDAYASGTDFYNWWMRQRDQDGDGLMEWGAHAVLESVRDGLVAVWDEVAWPSNFESVSLNAMLVVEARSLAQMARALGDTTGSTYWTNEAEERAERVRQTFWDEDTGFFYNVDRDDHDFSFEQPADLKRQEITGFLPLWAGIATEEQAAALVGHLTDESKFWRPHGVPSLAADDPYYDPSGYWNGPVWVEWQYLLFRGLLEYGYQEAARELAERVIDKVTFHLARDHTFWEMYSPDTDWAGHHQTYIWTAMVARMVTDLQMYETSRRTPPDGPTTGDATPTLGSNWPEPFTEFTTIKYQVPNAQEVQLAVYDTLGRKVATLVNEKVKAGVHEVRFEARGLASGVYFCQLQTSQQVLSEKLVRVY